ncbi:oxidoreductase [Planomonospora sphaerica]|uniref:Oxidoreductase n=1 Tax=Planomonospora sphaerica TaxID=161355 RepID=A0A171DIS4_9ACTN|nr:GNAT family N-acetyltransferase [Planomonospora sphaerica]GAT68782.1 oxidoreductase [Planomonospora sphaerica]
MTLTTLPIAVPVTGTAVSTAAALIPPRRRGNVTAHWHTGVPTELEHLQPPHLMHTPTWARAWSTVVTEQIRLSRFLHLHAPGVDRLAAFHLLERSPFWDWLERDAGREPAYPLLSLGSVYGTYGGAGLTDPDMIALTVEGGSELARHQQARALVVPNLTPDLLTLWERVRPGARRVPSSVAYSAPMPTGSLDEALPVRRQRRDLARLARRAADAGVRVRHLHGADMRPRLERFTALATAASLKHGTNNWALDVFTAVAVVPGAVLIAAEHGGELVGGFLCFRYAERLYAWAAGLDYARLRELGLYGTLVHATACYAVDTKARVLDMGRANHDYKLRLGLTPVELTSLVYAVPSAVGRVNRCEQ